MKITGICVVAIILAVLCGCETVKPPPDNSYEKQVNEASGLTDRAEQIYHEAVKLYIGSERNGKMKKAYKLASTAMEMLNKLDEKYGGTEVPAGRIPIHVPVYEKCTKVIAKIVKGMGIG